MRVKTFASLKIAVLEKDIQEFMENPYGVDDNEVLVIHHIKYSTVYSECHDVITFSALIIYNGRGR